MTKKEKALHAVQALKNKFPDSICSLNAENPLQLIIATRLSAQCTDARVNLVTPALFEKYPSENELAEAPLEDVENLIHSCGFYHGKARDLIGMATMVRDIYGGILPDTIEELTKLPGVGRKTANVIASVIYDKPVIAVDTHVFRVSRRMGLSDGSNVEAVERDLTAGFAPELRPKAHHWLILHGRYVCTARKPKCMECGLKDLCREYIVNNVII